MDLKIFFSPIEEEHFAHIKQANSFYKNIKVYTDKMPPYREADIAIIGVNEEAGTEHNKGTAKGSIEIRKKLFNLKKRPRPL
ncbi:hypothetical protein [Fulvivirga maritima]|uniref:hypothetical protein n=1 Tax=Fulvivirga maritima TaxID=2904247 RepID=UPI002795AA31|nr:hypothetical protein [Fulvivirga maritima]